MKMTFTAAIALAAFLACPTTAVDAHDDAPALYAAENELAQVAIKDDDEASMSEGLSDNDTDSELDEADMDELSAESEESEMSADSEESADELA